jgi:hypothetical protein
VTKPPKDLGASMQARLRNLAQQRGCDVQLLLTQFVLERLLHRLAASPHASLFLLKGAMLFAAWTKVPHRATRDLDLLGQGPPELGRLVEIFRDIVAVTIEPDGVSFDATTVQAARIREDQPYQGVRVTMAATMATARVGVQVDIGFGDAVHPGPVDLDYPSLLGLPTTRLRAYPRETVVAEKFQAMVSLGELNSRMKDFYDLFTLARQFEFDATALAGAIRATFARRTTDLPEREPIALRKDFAELKDKKVQWSAFARRGKLVDPDITLTTIVLSLHQFLWPIVCGLRGARPMPRAWPAGGAWL